MDELDDTRLKMELDAIMKRIDGIMKKVDTLSEHPEIEPSKQGEISVRDK